MKKINKTAIFRYSTFDVKRLGFFLIVLITSFSARAQLTTYTPNAAGYTSTVPAGVTTMSVTVAGGKGGNYGATGGPGQRVSALYSVTPGTNYYVFVGYSGANNSWNGTPNNSGGGENGGGGGFSGSIGGGASDIRTSITGGGASAASIASRIIVGGGGGGAAFYSCSSGGGSAGYPNGNAGVSCGGGCYESGGGGTQSAGGTAGGGGACGASPGTQGAGGNTAGSADGGGGGGGYWGGGGGAAAGGGGGSSYYTTTGLLNTPTLANNAATGSVNICYYPGILTQPATSTTVCQSGTFPTLSVDVNPASGAVTYQWYINASNNTTTGTPLGGATAASYSGGSTATIGTRYYYCVVQNACGQQATTTAAVVVLDGTTPAVPVISSTSATCNSITLNWGAVTSAGNYQVDITSDPTFSTFPAGTGSFSGLVGNVLSYTLSGLSSTTTYYYRVRAQNTCAAIPFSAFTSTANIGTTQTPTISGGLATLCATMTTTWTGTPAGGVWSSSNSSVATVTGGLVNAVSAGTSTIGYASGGCTANQLQTVTVAAFPPAFTITPASATICAGAAQLLTAPAVPPYALPGGSYSQSTGAISVALPQNTTGTPGGGGSSTITIPAGTIPVGATISKVSVKLNTTGITGLRYQSDYSFVLKGPNGNRIVLINNPDGDYFGANSATNHNEVTFASDASTSPAYGVNLNNSTWAAQLVNDAPGNLNAATRSNSTLWSDIWGTPNGAWTLTGVSWYQAGASLTDWTINIEYSTPLAGNYVWSATTGLYTDASLTTPYTGTSALSVYASPAAAATFTATATYGGFTCPTRNTTTINVNPRPSITPGTMPNVCTGTTSASLSYSAPTNSPTTYSIAWTGAASGLFTTVTDASLPASPITIAVPLTAVGGTTYTGNLTVKNAAGCISTVIPITVQVTQMPTITGTTPATRCNPGVVNLGATASTGTVNWYTLPATGTSLNTGTTYSPNISTTTTYYVDATNGICVSSPRTAVVGTVNYLPTPFSATVAPIPSCVNGVVTLTGSATGGVGVSYAWTGPQTLHISSATSLNAAITDAALSDAGVYTLTATAPACGSTAVTTTALVVNPRPTVTFISSPSANSCEGVDVTYTTQPGQASYIWSIPGIDGTDYQITGGSTLPTSNSVTIKWLSPTSKTVTVNYTNPASGCTGATPASNTTLVNPKPLLNTVTGGGTYCTGGTGVPVGLNPSEAGVNYQLYLGVTPTGSAVAGTGSAISFGLQTATGTYAVVGTNTVTACSNTMSGTVSIATTAPPSTYTLSGGGSFCAGGTGVSMLLSDSDPGVAYQLYVGVTPVGGLVTGTGSSLTFSSLTDPGSYSVVANPGSGPGCATTMSGNPSVTVNPLPAAISGVPNVCVGTNITLSSTGTGNWTSSNTSLAVVNATGVVTGVAVGSPVVSFTLTSTGCYRTSTVTVSPNAGTISGVTTLCVGGVTTLSNVAGGTWSSNNTMVSIVAGTGVMTANTIGSSIVSYITGPGCSTTANITVNGLPTVTSVTPSALTFCTGATMTLTGAGASGIGSLMSYNWSGPSSYSSTSTTNTKDVALSTTLLSGIYSLTVTYPGPGCTSAPVATSNITVSAAPALTSASNNGPICVGDQLVLSANGATNVSTYSWAGPVSFTGGASTASATVAPTTAAAAGVYTVTVANSGGTGCTVRYMTTGVVNALPTTPTVSGGGGPFCGSTTLTASNGGSGTIYFQGTNATGTSTAIPAVLQVVNATGTYHFRALSAGGCWSAPGAGAAVTVSPLPTAFAITGGGSYCTGGAGVNICLAGSETGVSYQLYEGAFMSGASVNGTNGVICFGLRTNPGTYTVVGTRTAGGCTNNMTGSTTIAVTPVPSAYSVIGGGAYCSGGAGVSVGLNGSDAGVSYQLYNNGVAVGSLVTGTGSSITFGPQTSAGSYSVVANPSATCATSMTNGVTVTITTPPTAFSVSGSGSYCPGSTGLHVLLSGSQSSTDYQLYKDGIALGSAVAGTTGALDFGAQTAGTYAIVATNTSTSCTNTMTGTAVITTSALPTVFATTGGGAYCSGGTGVVIGMANSTTGVNYVAYNSAGGSTAAVGGSTGNPISFGLQTTAGTYTVIATNATTFCSSMMSGNPVITITATPQPHNVVGGGNQCAGGLGFDLGVDGSEAGVSYQLYRNGIATGLPVTGTGAAVDLGLQTLAGTYTVKANPGTNCEVTMTGSAVVNIVSLPNAFTVTGGGTYCTGGSGFHVGVNGSESNVNYQLYKDGTPVGLAVAGGSGAIDFGVLMSAGTYKVIGTSSVTGCSRTMTDSAIITVYPTALTHTVTGGGQYCEDGAGLNIGLDGSEVGVIYQLYRAGLPVGSIVSGTGLAISFGNQTIAGQYAVVANPASTCAATMTNSVTVTINPKPTQYNVTGTGAFCAGGTGLDVGLSGSNTGISYQLYRNGSLLGSAMAGTNSALSFGVQATAGTYTVLATNGTTGCQNAMAGQATITVNPAPTVYSVTGGGGFCTGGTGVHVGLSGSTAGMKYQLYNGVIPQGIALTGTGSALDFGLITLGGTYTVIAQDPVTLCTANMSGATAVVANSLPTAYTASGTGSFCSGGAGIHIILSNSTSGVNYQLYNNSGALGTPVAGTNSSLDFGAITAGGTYTVVATNGTTGCQNNMTGNPVITVNPLPVVQSVNGGGAYCQGGTGVLVGLANSQAGVTYNLMRGATLAGSVVSTGGAFNFSAQTVAGTYTVLATTALGCSAVMSGAAIVTMNALPTAYTVSGTGAYCSGGTGLNVTLSGSATGINYQLYNGGSTVSTPMPGTGAALNFGPQTAAGTYTVQATDATTGCTNIMAGSAVITVNATPALATVTGGGAYCSGGTGVNIGLTSPTTSGISYQLVNGSGPVGAPIVSTGGAVSFGLITGAGTYSVIASNTVTGCSATMSGNATVTVNPLPQIYAVSGGGVYCAGGNGFSITTSGSNLGINYQLMLAGSPVGSAMAGTGSGLNFGAQTAPGAYTVVATNGATGCTANMSGTATISVNSAPSIFAMTGGGSYCSGGTGVDLGLAGSTLGVNYQLFNGSTLVTTVAGTNSAITFGSQMAAGTYTVAAVNSITGCQSPMSGFKNITINALPLVYTVSGTGSYCQGGAGVTVVMNNSESTVNYQLYRGATMVGSPVQGVNGPLSFGAQMTGGVYTVVASNITTGCTSNMAGSATVTVNPLPTMYTVTGGGNYCQGGTGVNVGLNASNTGINYKLYNGATLMGNTNGTGSAISFGLQTTVGTYTVLATNNATGCTAVMSGVATVGTNALPGAQLVTGGGNYCSNDAGVAISLANSVSGINYQLYRGSTPVGLPVAGVDGPLSFPLQTVAGTYSVTASDATTGCSLGMTGSATVGINQAPTLFTVTGGGNYCQGGAGMLVGLSSSTTGVEYELYLNGSTTGTTVMGNGNPISFGLQTAVGTYSVNARNVSTNCATGMSGVAVVGINNLPNVYPILGAASSYCAGGTGIDMVLTNSQVGVNYQLINGSVAIGFAVPGTGTVLDFGNQTVAGTYIVQATNATTGCSAYMASSASVVISPLPTIYTVTGGGGYCAGTAGAAVGLSSSNTGITYKLYRGATLVNSFAGTGSALDFGPQTAGAYTVVAANNTTTCSSNMAGGANVSVNTLPDTYNVTGGGNYCAGGTGVAVGLSNSQTGVNYQLYNGTSAVGFPVAGASGSPITFGAQTGTGSYTVMGINASTNCGVSMTGNVTIGTNITPDVYTVTGGGHFCNGGAGVAVGLSNSVAGIRYELFNGATLVSTMMGTGSAINFGVQATAGSYAAVATNTVTGCSANMSGTPAVTIDPLPTVFLVGGGGSYCAGGTGVAVTLGSSHTGINYQLYNGSSTVGFPVAGTGAALSLGMQTAVGTYSVMATNAATGCMMGMTGSATVSITNVVTPAVTISSGMGDSVCAGVPTSFTATTVNGGTSPAYSWTVNGSSTGVSSATLTYMPTNGDIIAVTMTSSAACATPAVVNDAMVVSVLPIGAPSVNVTADPGNQVCEGTTVMFTAAPTLGGTAPAYYWVRGTTVVGTGSTFSYAPNDNDVVYCMMVSNYTCRTIDTVFSNTTRMEVAPPVVPTITITADPGVKVHPNTEVTLTAVVTNAGTSPTFQWYIGSSAIPGATGPTLTSANFSTGDSITCVVTSSSACKLSAFNSVVMTVFPVGVDQVSLGNSDIKLMPNPNKGWFTVKGTLGVTTDEEVTLEVTNMLGQTVYNNKIIARNGNIDERIELGNNLANGMYMLSLKAQSGNKVFHIVVEQ